MKKLLTHPPKRKKDELKRITEVVRRKIDDLHLLILFGSHAHSDPAEPPNQRAARPTLETHRLNGYD